MNDVFNNRDYGYTVVSRLELALRGFLIEKLTLMYENVLEEIPKGIVQKARSRIKNTEELDLATTLEYSDFPDIREIIIYNDKYELLFPDSEMTRQEFSTLIDSIYSQRCRIDHVRTEYTKDDFDNLVAFSSALAIDLSMQGAQFLEFIHDLSSGDNSVEIIKYLTLNESCENLGISNNIPVPDYVVDGGFIGRTDDLQRLIKIFKSGLHRVVTIAGAGGVGKTALAHRIIEKFTREKIINFNGIVWVSAKEDRLTHLGIEAVDPTIEDYEDLLDTIAGVMQFEMKGEESIEKKEEHVNTILDMYDRTLLVIDNLETIRDSRIYDFILDAHPKLYILITSRKGLGQVERRLELSGLKLNEAARLFRIISSEKSLDTLASMPDEIVNNIVSRLSCYPLAIKWAIGNVAIGKSINDIISTIHEETSDVSLFCFDLIFRSLSSHSCMLLYAMTFFTEPVSFGPLTYISGLTKNDFEDSIHELLLVSLILQSQISCGDGQVVNHYALLPLTRGYLLNKFDSEPQIKSNFCDKFRSYQSLSSEAGKVNKHYASGLSDYGAQNDAEKIAAMFSQTAFQKASAGLYQDALELFGKAAKIAPHLPGIYRTWAIVEPVS